MSIKIDIGKIFPGIIFLALGIIVLLIWIIIEFISFVFNIHFSFNLILLIIAIAGIIAGLFQILSGISGIWSMISKK